MGKKGSAEPPNIRQKTEPNIYRNFGRARNRTFVYYSLSTVPHIHIGSHKSIEVNDAVKYTYAVCTKNFVVCFSLGTLSLVWFSINVSMHQFEAVTVKLPWEVPKDEMR